MPPLEWYYAKDNKQCGPTTAPELRRLAQTGELKPDDLVWHEGMEAWTPGRKVKGLFDVEMALPPKGAPTSARPAPPASMAAPAARPMVPMAPSGGMGAGPQAATLAGSPVSPGATTVPLSPGTGAMSSPSSATTPIGIPSSNTPPMGFVPGVSPSGFTGTPPGSGATASAAAPLSSGTGGSGPIAPVTAPAAPAAKSPAWAGSPAPAGSEPQAPVRPATEAQATESWHPLEVMLGAARHAISAQFVDGAVRLFSLIGLWSLVAAIPTVALFYLLIGLSVDGVLICGVELKGLPVIVVGLGAAIVLAVLHYSAYRLLPELDRLHRSTGGVLSNSALPNTIALLGMATGLAALIGYSGIMIQTQSLWGICSAVQAFILWEFFGFVALNPASVGVSVEAARRPADEALGAFSFLVKTGLRTTPLAFGTGAALNLGCILVGFFLLVARSPDEFPAYVPGYVLAPTWGLLLYAAMPAAAYFLFLLHCLATTLILSVLVLPRKLDRLLERGPEGD